MDQRIATSAWIQTGRHGARDRFEEMRRSNGSIARFKSFLEVALFPKAVLRRSEPASRPAKP
jgi:hypothetical protein